jgi:hypothetical protein
MTSTPTTPHRTYTFIKNSSGTSVHWVDTWYSRFDRRWVSTTSATVSVPGWLQIPTVNTYVQTTFDSTGRVVAEKQATIDLWAATVTADLMAPAVIGLNASSTVTDAVQNTTTTGSNGGSTLRLGNGGSTLHIGKNPSQIHTISTGGSYDVARDVPLDPRTDPTAMMLPADEFTALPAETGNPPVALTVAGDFRRPKWARQTAALTNDELWAVNYVAGSHGLSGPEMMAILLELTGARRVAYHPDGFYGISNLSSALLTDWLTVDQSTAPFSGQVSGIGSIQDFLSASIYRQLVVTDACLKANLGGQSGVIPVFLLLATGTVPSNAGPATPLPPRLQPPSGNGTTLTGADVAARIANRVTQLKDEFTHRLPALCAPPPGATRLMPNQALYEDQSLPSLNGQFTLTYQSDGNLVLYRNGGGPQWASGTAGTTPGLAVMQSDGNLVIYDSLSNAIWASHTETHPSSRLNVDNAGFIAILGPDGTQVWRS